MRFLLAIAAFVLLFAFVAVNLPAASTDDGASACRGRQRVRHLFHRHQRRANGCG